MASFIKKCLESTNLGPDRALLFSVASLNLLRLFVTVKTTKFRFRTVSNTTTNTQEVFGEQTFYNSLVRFLGGTSGKTWGKKNPMK